MTLKVEDMPGPTPEAQALQLKQWTTLDEFYAARARQPFGQKENGPEATVAMEQYDATVVALVSMLGPDAHCSQVDSELWSTFSDVYKSHNSFRPRGYFTLTEVKDWLQRLANRS